MSYYSGDYINNLRNTVEIVDDIKRLEDKIGYIKYENIKNPNEKTIFDYDSFKTLNIQDLLDGCIKKKGEPFN